jgi:hypothetical protein
MDRCTRLSSPTFRAGLESAVHHPFRRHSTYSAVTTPAVAAGRLRPCPLTGCAYKEPRPTDLHTGIRCSDTSYSRTTLSLAVSGVSTAARQSYPSTSRLRPYHQPRTARSVNRGLEQVAVLEALLTTHLLTTTTIERFALQRWGIAWRRCRLELAWTVFGRIVDRLTRGSQPLASPSPTVPKRRIVRSLKRLFPSRSPGKICGVSAPVTSSVTSAVSPALFRLAIRASGHTATSSALGVAPKLRLPQGPPTALNRHFRPAANLAFSVPPASTP